MSPTHKLPEAKVDPILQELQDARDHLNDVRKSLFTSYTEAVRRTALEDLHTEGILRGLQMAIAALDIRIKVKGWGNGYTAP